MEKVWALFDDIDQFNGNPAAEYANPFPLDGGAVLALVYADAWSGPTLTEAEALALIDEQPIHPPPPDPPPPETTGPEPEPEPEPAPEPEPEPEPEEVVIDYNTWLKAELKEAALAVGITILSADTKAVIIEKLEAYPDQAEILTYLP